MGTPSLPPPPPSGPDAADQALQSARIMERRRQLGLQGRMSTFLSTQQDNNLPSGGGSTGKTLLGS
jgi:hypothetical protein